MSLACCSPQDCKKSTGLSDWTTIHRALGSWSLWGMESLGTHFARSDIMPKVNDTTLFMATVHPLHSHNRMGNFTSASVVGDPRAHPDGIWANSILVSKDQVALDDIHAITIIGKIWVSKETWNEQIRILYFPSNKVLFRAYLSVSCDSWIFITFELFVNSVSCGTLQGNKNGSWLWSQKWIDWWKDNYLPPSQFLTIRKSLFIYKSLFFHLFWSRYSICLNSALIMS